MSAPDPPHAPGSGPTGGSAHAPDAHAPDAHAPDAPNAPAPEGVRALDHTADVGLVVDAPDLPALFTRAALGMEWLLGENIEAVTRMGRGPARAGDVDITLYAPELPVLLADWLRELLYLRQVRGRRFESARFQELSGTALLARIRLAPAGEPVREIKGVTYHGLEADRAPGGGWRARVIMDV